MSLLRNHNILCFHRRKNGSHCRTRTYVQPLTGRNALPLCQVGGLRDLRFKSYRVCCGDRNKSITYKRQDRNNLGLNRLGLRNEPAPQPQHTLLSSPKNGSHCRTRTYVQPLTTYVQPFRCRDMGLHMLLLLHAIIPFLACMLHHVSMFFWHFNPYILQHFTENVFDLVSLVFTVCSCITIPLSYRLLYLAYL